MGSPRREGPVVTLDSNSPTSTVPPIHRSVGVEALNGTQKVRSESKPALALGLDPSKANETADAVTELLQRALSMKEGGGEEAVAGERTPGSHSRASTDHTAVDPEEARVSPLNAASPNDTASRPSASRTNSLTSDPTPPLSRLRNPSSSNTRRPPTRPHPPPSRHSQQRITPPHGWNATSPSSSSDGIGYALPFHHPNPQYYYPSQQYSGAASNTNSTGPSGSYGYHQQNPPPFLTAQHRQPSQLSDQSAYSTGSPYSVASSIGSTWYQHYSSAVTTPSGYPTPTEGNLVHVNDGSPEGMSDVSSSRGPSQAYQLDPALSQSYGGQAQQYHATMEASQASGGSPYNPVYFPPPHRMVLASPPSSQGPTSQQYHYSPDSSATGQPYSSAPMAYPISSTQPSAPSPHPEQQYTARGEYPIRSASGSWSAAPPPLPSQPAYPSQNPYVAYSPPSHPIPVDPRGFSHQYPRQSFSEGPSVNFGMYPNAVPPRTDFPPPPIPPRPSIPNQFSPTSSHAQLAVPPPKIYVPPAEISRGVLASNRLREAAQPSTANRPVRATRNDRQQTIGPKKGNLPKPPIHSPHALWVGNVPSDASHSELWQFFVSRPPPSAVGLLSKDDLDLQTPGVESIHLIARSNCAFVNYVSDLHLQHAITVSTGLSLRPNDARCKNLICRVRKQEDESKTGVGAQRTGGMHRAFVKLQQERMTESAEALRTRLEAETPDEKSPTSSKALEERRQSSSSVSIGTTSTTSSFLTKHFERRWFIMKSHDEADLKLSVESGLWATQPHNEPVLQQAYRTAKEVFLVFSANGSGEWFGFARMTGPITSVASTASRPSWGSGEASIEESASSASLSAPSQTIPEDSDASFPPRPPVIFSPSEHRLAQASPSNITPSSQNQSRQQQNDQRHGGSYPTRLPSEIDAQARRDMAIEQERMAFKTATNLHLPAAAAEAAKRAATYDSSAMSSAKKNGTSDVDEVPPGTLREALRRIDAEEPDVKKEDDEETRRPARSGSSSTWGTPFTVEWIKVSRLPFSRTRHIRNSFNGNREIKVSRDGTEVEPAAGQALLDEFTRVSESLDMPAARTASIKSGSGSPP